MNALAVSPPGEKVSIGRSTWQRGSRAMLERPGIAATLGDSDDTGH
jgi:hypothetical protein